MSPGGPQGRQGPRQSGARLAVRAARRGRDSRARVGRLVALEGVGQVVLVVHVALCAQVVVEADDTLPAHAAQAVLLAAVADDVGVPHAWGRGRAGSGRGRCSPAPRPARPHTDLGVVVEQQVVPALVARAVVGARAVVPLHDDCAVGRRRAAVAAELHHGAHAALATVLRAPLPVHAAHHAHAHLHARLGVRVHCGWVLLRDLWAEGTLSHRTKATKALDGSEGCQGDADKPTQGELSRDGSRVCARPGQRAGGEHAHW